MVTAPPPDASGEVPAACRAARPVLPDADRPSAAEVSALRGCDSEAEYYGIGRAPDPVRARKCAFVEIESAAPPVFGGNAILMMVYANGRASRVT